MTASKTPKTPKTTVKTPGQRIRQRRKELQLTQEVLAQRVGCNPVTMWRYECMGMSPGMGRLTLIALELGVSVDWIVSGRAPVPQAPANDVSRVSRSA